jgi:hypothetical protein
MADPEAKPGALGKKPPPDFGGFNIVGIYARWTLDCVVEAATAIAQDYRTRYRQYRAVPEAIVDILADMNSRMGYDPAWPNTAQRAAIDMPLLGSSDAQANADTTSPFHQTALTVRTAAVAYSERVYDTGEPMLRQAFIDAARHFQAYLSTLSGGVINRARQDTESIFRQSVRVLTTAEVAQAFGVPPAPPKAWPLPDKIADDDYLNGDGAYLMEEVSRVLQPPDGLITQQYCLTVQRVAVSGARTIQRILQGAHNDTDVAIVRGLIEVAYTWATALRDLEVGVPPVK